MSDTKENQDQDKATPKRTSKLSLGKKLGARAKQNLQGGAGVTVEVKKVRGAVRRPAAEVETPKTAGVDPETAAALSALSRGRKAGEGAPVDAGDDDGLSERERRARLRALQSVAETDEEERRQAEERAKIAEERAEQRRVREEAERKVLEAEMARKAAVESAPPAESEEKRSSHKSWKKKHEDDEEEETVKSKSASKKKRRPRSDDDTIKDLSEFDISMLAEEDEEGHSLVLEDDEVEDYSEEIEEDDDLISSQVVLGKSGESDETGVVQAIKGAPRAIVTAADPEKRKKYLRSEARVGKGRRSSEGRTATEQAQAELEKRLAQASRKKKPTLSRKSAPQQKILREVILPETIEVGELANRMAERSVDVVRELMKMGMMVKQGDTIDADTAQLIVEEFGHSVKRVSDADVEAVVFEETEEDAAEDMESRPPIVTVMGHVDHGKTSLLDALRETDVVAGEAGGITQHIGAYQVTLPSGGKITFLDTPGHAAFTAMRARGADLTDIVVLVVAADDGIMEQTQEAISHAKAANVPIIVAVNKIDKPDADPQRVRTELMNFELVPEEFGGDVMVVDVSALKKQNLDKLEEAILLQSEVLELKANPNRRASGIVVEARMEKGRGVVATLLVQKGTLKTGDIVVAGTAFGRVRMMQDDKGRAMKEVGPAMPVELLGLDEVPAAGEPFAVSENDRAAREIVDFRLEKLRDSKFAPHASVSLEDLFSAEGAAKVKELPLIIKADVHGSMEAIVTSLQKIEHDEVEVKVVHSGVGAITESDVSLAEASNAIILGFNVRAAGQAKRLAEASGVDIRYYSVIYNLIDDIKDALSGLLSPDVQESLLGYAEIREVFNITKQGKVAGCFVTEGMVKRGAKVRLLRDNVVIHEGALKTLKRFKDDVKEVREGYECGMAFERYDDIRPGDVIEAFELQETERKIQ